MIDKIMSKETAELLGYRDIPTVDQYGLSVRVVKEYLDSQRKTKNKWYKYANEESIIKRAALIIAIIAPIIGFGVFHSHMMVILLVILYALAEYLYQSMIKKRMNTSVKTIELPSIEKYLNALHEWEVLQDRKLWEEIRKTEKYQ